MQNAVIIDSILAAVVLLAVILGAKRGLYRSLVSCAVIVLALLGANWFADTCTPGVSDVLRPAILARVESRVDTAVDGTVGAAEAENDDLLASAEELLRAMGWDGDLAASVRENTHAALQSAKSAIAAAMVDSFLDGAVGTVLKLLGFLLLLLALKLASKLLQPLFSLPVLRQADMLGGTLLGLAEGILLAWLLVWLARRTGLLLPTEELLSSTHLLDWFVR